MGNLKFDGSCQPYWHFSEYWGGGCELSRARKKKGLVAGIPWYFLRKLKEDVFYFLPPPQALLKI